MATPPKPAIETIEAINAYASKWKAGRQALEAEYEADQERDTKQFEQDRKLIETELQADIQRFNSGQAVMAPALHDFVEEKYRLKLDPLRTAYEARKAARKAEFDRQCLAHLQEFGPKIDLIMQANIQHTPANAGSAIEVARAEGRQMTLPLPSSSQPLGSTPTGRHIAVRSSAVATPSSVEASSRAQESPVGRIPRPNRADKFSTSHNETTIPINAKDAPAARHPLPGQKPGHQKTIAHDSPNAKKEPISDLSESANNSKRKADDAASPPGPGKRRRSDARRKQAETDEPHPPASPALPKRVAAKRTIDFEEVYQGGKADYKHMIIEYPPNEGNWYILKCDEHGVHFNTNPLHGAAKHLHSGQHDNMSKEHSLAIKVLGHLVFDCDKDLANKNNEAVKKAFEAGYKPFNQNQLSKAARASMGLPTQDGATPKKAPVERKEARAKAVPGPGRQRGSKPFSGILYPVVGEVYKGYWGKNKTWYAVIVLPWGDFGEIGMTGTLKSTGLLEKPPKCYAVDHETKDILGWAPGYEDNGPLVGKREFPVMYVDGNNSVGWLRAKDMSMFDFEDGNPKDTPYYDKARDKYAERQGFPGYEDMRRHRQKAGLPPKRYSAVGNMADNPAESPAGTIATPPSTAVASKKPRKQSNLAPDDLLMRSDKAGRSTADTEMPDAPALDDDTESYRESDVSVLLESDEDGDVEMADSRRTSVSNKGLPRSNDDKRVETGHELADTAQNNISALAALAYAKTTKTAQGQEDDTVAEQAKVDEDAVPAVEAASDGLDGKKQGVQLNGRANRPRTADSARNEPPTGPVVASRPASASSSVADPGSRRVEKIFARSTRGLRASRSPAMASASLPQKRATDSAGSSGVDVPARAPIPAALPEKSKDVGSSRTNDAGTHTTPSKPPPAKDDDSIMVQPRVPTKTTLSSQPAPSIEGGKSPALSASRRSSEDVGNASRAATSTSPPISSAVPVTKSSLGTPATMPLDHPSRTSTPTIIRPEEGAQSNRWRAVRSESIPANGLSASTHKSDTTPSAAVDAPSPLASVEPPKDSPAAPKETSIDLTSRSNTPLPPKTASSGKEEYFELAYYDDMASGSFHKQKDGPLLWLAANNEAKTLETGPGQALQFTLNPLEIQRVTIEPQDETNGANCMVSLLLKDGQKEQKLLFETSKAMGREESGRIHARRFCRWVKSCNSAIDYRNKSFDSSGRTSGSYSIRPN